MTELGRRPRICVAIPHYLAVGGSAKYGSERSGAQVRGGVLTRCLYALHHQLGPTQGFISGMYRCNTAAEELKVVVCTSGDCHALSHVPAHLFVQHAVEGDPRYLGYACHEVLAQHASDYDFLCYLEDDLLVIDPAILVKARWFVERFGEDTVLQPQRFEAGDVGVPVKLYIDGALSAHVRTGTFQDVGDQSTLRAHELGRDLAFIRFENPHAGCFFLTSAQMRRWMNEPYFLDRSAAWVGPLESAATLGLMRAFRVYKPALGNAAFLEVEHLDHRHVNRIPSEFA